MRYFYIILIFYVYALLSICFGKTGYPSFDVFHSPSQLSLGGAVFLNPSPISSKMNPSVADTGKKFSTSIIRYHANIISQSVGLSVPWRNGVGTFFISHISYGTFNGYDTDGDPTGKYQSGDTWLNGVYSKQLKFFPVRTGFSIQYFNSVLKDHNIIALLFSLGSEVFIHSVNGSLGVSFHNIGFTFKTNNFAKGSFAPKTVLSGSKELAHLPLTLFFDSVYLNQGGESDVFLGCIFKLKNNLRFQWGSSTRKINHNINQDIFQTILGATGLGIGYCTDQTKFHYGTFVFGTGASSHGLEITVQL